MPGATLTAEERVVLRRLAYYNGRQGRKSLAASIEEALEGGPLREPAIERLVKHAAYWHRQGNRGRGDALCSLVASLPETLEHCICGECFHCPDGWHRGDDLPCSCTPDCVLGDEECPECGLHSVQDGTCRACGYPERDA